MRLVALVGNPNPRSRTFTIAELVAEGVAEVTGASHDLTVDLCDYSSDLFTWPHDGLSELTATVASADILVVATPTYKATYTGLLKAFLDRYPSGGLANVLAIPVMTMADVGHTMAVDFALRPLLVELGASVPTRGLAFQMLQYEIADAVVDEWLASNKPVLDRSRPPG